MLELVVGENSYCTLEEFITYIKYRPYLKFLTGATSDELVQHLVMAYDKLSGFQYEDSPTTEEDESLTVEEWVKQAQMQEAVALFILHADDDFLAREQLRLQGVSKFIFDKQTEEYKKRPRIAGLYSSEAWECIKSHVMRYPRKVQHSL